MTRESWRCTLKLLILFFQKPFSDNFFFRFNLYPIHPGGERRNFNFDFMVKFLQKIVTQLYKSSIGVTKSKKIIKNPKVYQKRYVRITGTGKIKVIPDG